MLLSPVLAKVPEKWDPSRCVKPTAVGDVATIQGLECVFKNIVAIVVPFAGIAVFVMLLAGGLKYLTSGGDPKASEQAKNTMTYAIFGLVAIIASYLILNFLATFTGLTGPNGLLNFTIPGP